jgi:hypothetical protein
MKRKRNASYARNGGDNRFEHKQALLLDELAAFEEFRKEIMPQLQQDLKDGLAAEQIFKKYAHFAAARGITIALTDKDAGRALTAIKDILDRTQGKAVERKEIKASISELPDEQLDALLESAIGSERSVDELKQ